MTHLSITDNRARFYIAFLKEAREFDYKKIFETDLYEKAKAAGAANNRTQFQTIIRELIDLNVIAHTFDPHRKATDSIQFAVRPKDEIIERLENLFKREDPK